ncbi:hypothetical protein RCF19_03960 [Rhodococcus qingshengii]
MGTDLRAIMDRDERMSKMLRDPDLTDDALLFALAGMEVIKQRRQSGRRRDFRSSHWMDEIAQLAFGGTETTARYRVKRIIADDVPRYQAPYTSVITCPAPMIRREGLCGKRASTSWVDRDPMTGEGEHVGYCSRHFTPQVDVAHRERLADWVANGKPSPPPNCGGVLARYFRTDWPKWYAWAAPGRTPMEGGKEATPPRPVFELIQGG